MTDPLVEEVEVLRRLAIFGALRPETIAFLRDRCERVTLAEGECFFRQGQAGDSVFVLRSGRVAIVRELGESRLVLAELISGQCFGEVALVAIGPRTATVQALEETTVLRLRVQAILDLHERDLEQFTILQMNLGREVARRLAKADEVLFEYARRCGDLHPETTLLRRSADAVK